MKITFAITTDFSDNQRIDQIIKSIRNLEIPCYEILIIGESIRHVKNSDTRFLFFDNSKYPGWITKKKNILVKESLYENIVIFHDYYVFDPDWYINFTTFGTDWEICSNAQHLITGRRHFTDWVVWDSPIYPRFHSLDYTDWNNTKHMYISGGYMFVKKHVVLQQPFNENLCWGQAEDVEWSLRVRDKYLMKCNGNSLVTHNKKHRDA